MSKQSSARSSRARHGEDSPAVQFLHDRAKESKVTLPPLGTTPRHWPKMLQAPRGTPLFYGTTQRGYLLSVMKACRGPIAVQTVALSIGTVIGALLPAVLGTSIDSAINNGLSGPTWAWLGLFTGLILVMSLGDGANQMGEIATFLNGCFGPARSVAHRISRAGRAAKQDKPAGDVVTGIINDSDMVGAAVMFVAEVVSSVLAIIVVTIVMYNMSPLLGTVVVIGLPIALISIALLVKPMQKKFAHMREEQGKLTTISTDAVMGLRVLRGVGGETYYNIQYREQSQRVKAAGIKVARNQAALTITRTSVPQLFIAVVTGLGAFLTFQGVISVGELVAFAGMTAFLSTPFAVAGQAAYLGSRAWVGAKKLTEFSAVEPPTNEELLTDDAGLLEMGEINFGSLPLVDLTSGVTIQPGVLTAVVAPSPSLSAALAKRLARVSDEAEVRIGETDLRRLPLTTVRKGILLSEDDAQLFRGTLHAGLRGVVARDPDERGVTELVYREHLEEAARKEGTLFRPDRVPDDPRLGESMRVADAGDVLDSMSGGMAGWLAERGRNLSGGQRQRVALARAIYADAPILVAVEPTSAVDSHTEERISAGIRDERAGKTTVVISASPLWLEKCDEVVVLDEDGLECARGTHGELKAAAAAGDPGALLYRTIVDREAGETDETSRG
ncbi:ABC transporter ATP-binding protein [Actinomyces minihominis]|uniref:ABC transporter ATP-binding protein n=1 Tax=Actinomyces minihominis TaxID=2002838 RepID=UPI000C080892|nr:ABC transporter ATP-binding protein [Actinomyces minihominis]